MKGSNAACAIYGIDIGKSVFHICGCDKHGRPILRKKLTRKTIIGFFVNAPAALIGMEACPSSQWLARKLSKQGHDAKIMAAQFVKPYLKNQKNDANDAEAIAEAVMQTVSGQHKMRLASQGRTIHFLLESLSSLRLRDPVRRRAS